LLQASIHIAKLINSLSEVDGYNTISRTSTDPPYLHHSVLEIWPRTKNDKLFHFPTRPKDEFLPTLESILINLTKAVSEQIPSPKKFNENSQLLIESKGGINPDCIFCKIIARIYQGHIVYEDEYIIAFLNLFPTKIGETLILPKQHYQYFHQIPIPIGSHLLQITSKLIKILKDFVGSEGVNIIQNTGKAGGQMINHAHMLLLPRSTDDHVFHAPAPSKEWITKEEGERMLGLFHERL